MTHNAPSDADLLLHTHDADPVLNKVTENITITTHQMRARTPSLIHDETCRDEDEGVMCSATNSGVVECNAYSAPVMTVVLTDDGLTVELL